MLQVSVGVNGNGSAGTLVGVTGYPVAATAPSVPYGLPGIPYPLGYNYISGLTTSVSCINPQMPMQVMATCLRSRCLSPAVFQHKVCIALLTSAAC